MGKRLQNLKKLIDKGKSYSINEAISIVKKTSTAKFDETIEAHIKLGINLKNNNSQSIRGLIVLPHSINKQIKIAVCTKGEKQRDAQLSGADFVGFENLIDSIINGKIDFDVLIATPDIMKDLSKVANILGPRRLMPNVKSGTITFDLSTTIKELKLGRIEYKNDSYGIIHIAIGKASFQDYQLVENVRYFIHNVIKSSTTNNYLKSIYLSSTMGPSILVNSKL
ncbi:MAG: 50S ribosomal protein L1 [Endomicrobium sp.]|jgi:large subunit ribosomal protein L1|nr:50S ribosomal protein L1 [Endomicrobium sp.]